MSLFNELKCRNVFQVGFPYAVVDRLVMKWEKQLTVGWVTCYPPLNTRTVGNKLPTLRDTHETV